MSISRSASFKVYKTRIGGRRLALRLGRFLIDSACAWDVPWGQYESAVYVRFVRMAMGYRLRFRIWKVYFKGDVQVLPKKLFHGWGAS